MSATELQQQRMKSYFVDSAKEILRGEGLKVASARNIAERAGYSYATLYNYFEDLTALIFESVKDFQIEIEQMLEGPIIAAKTGKEKVRAGTTAWVNYFVQYPGIFELFFLERIGESGNRQDISNTIYNSILPAIKPGIELMIKEGELYEAEADIKKDALRLQTAGLLLYYGNRRNPPDYNSLLEALNKLLDTIL